MKNLLLGLFLVNLTTYGLPTFAKSGKYKDGTQLTEENFDSVLFASSTTNEIIVRTKAGSGFEILLCNPDQDLKYSCEKLSTYVIPRSESVERTLGEKFEKHLNEYIEENFKEDNVFKKVGTTASISAFLGFLVYANIIADGNNPGIARPAYPNYRSFAKGMFKKISYATLIVGGLASLASYTAVKIKNKGIRSMEDEIQIALDESQLALERALIEEDVILGEEEKNTYSELTFTAIKESLKLALQGKITVNPLDGTVIIY